MAFTHYKSFSSNLLVANTHLRAVCKGWQSQRLWFHACGRRWNLVKDMEPSQEWVSHSWRNIDDSLPSAHHPLVPLLLNSQKPRKTIKFVDIHSYIISVSFPFLPFCFPLILFLSFTHHLTHVYTIITSHRGSRHTNHLYTSFHSIECINRATKEQALIHCDILNTISEKNISLFQWHERIKGTIWGN